MTYDVTITATFNVSVHGKDTLRKLWDYVDRKLQETAADSEDAMEHGYPPVMEVTDLPSNPNYMDEINMVMLEGAFTFHTLKRKYIQTDPDYGFSIVVHPNIPQLEFAEYFPKFMKEIGCEDWTCNSELWRLDSLISNLQLLKSHAAGLNTSAHASEVE